MTGWSLGRWRFGRAAIPLAAGVLLAASGGYASELPGWGPRVGLSDDPEQFVVGLHLDLYPIAEGVRFVPNADVGFGDDLFLATVNMDVLYVLPIPIEGEVFVGGSVGLAHRDPTRDAPGRRSETDVGVVGLIGYAFQAAPVRAEVRFGFSHAYPDLKFMIGYTLPFRD